MTVKKLMVRLATLAFAGIMALMLAAGAFAHTFSSKTAQWRGWCGGPATTKSQLINRWDAMGVTGSVSAFFGISPLNESLGGHVNAQFAVATLSHDATINNKGCSGGRVFSAGKKHLKAGTKVWINKTKLQAKWPGSFSLVPRKGFKRIQITVNFVAQTSCSNPGNGSVRIWIWIKVIKIPPVKKPKAPAKPTPPTVPTVTTIPCAGILQQVGVNQFICLVQTNNNTSTQTGTTSGQGSPVINIDQTTQVNVNQNQNQGQSQTSNSCSGSSNCSTTPAPCNCTTPPPPPPTKSAPVIESITVLNDVRIGDTSPTYCVAVKLDNADSGTIKFAPVYGKFSVMSSYGGTVNSDGSIVFNVTGGEHTYCATYNPPTEVPSGGQDDVVVTLATGVGTVQGTPASSPPSPWFKIEPKPVNP